MMTRRQWEMLLYLQIAADKGYCPSLDELAEGVGLASKSGAHRLLQGLVEMGFVRRTRSRRSIEILRKAPDQAPPQPGVLLARATFDALQNELRRRGYEVVQAA